MIPFKKKKKQLGGRAGFFLRIEGLEPSQFMKCREFPSNHIFSFG
jgi:hypothetical protein